MVVKCSFFVSSTSDPSSLLPLLLSQGLPSTYPRLPSPAQKHLGFDEEDDYDTEHGVDNNASVDK